MLCTVRVGSGVATLSVGGVANCVVVSVSETESVADKESETDTPSSPGAFWFEVVPVGLMM